jgi:mRNA-degrading endonuclease RelE of RelBE toxin-antitoxin system
LDVIVDRNVTKTMSQYSEKFRDQIYHCIEQLEDPYSASNVLLLFTKEQIYRMEIGGTFTVFFTIHKESRKVFVDDLMTIEQARERYRRYH